MNDSRIAVLTLALFLGLGSSAVAQTSPQSLPDEPFKTVHLMKVTPAQEAGFISAVSDFNREFAKQGCTSCAYHIAKLFGASEGGYNYMMTSAWPGRDVYIKIHTSTAFRELDKKDQVMSDIYATEIYGRYVDLK